MDLVPHSEIDEVDIMMAIWGHRHALTLRAVVMQGPPGAEVRRRHLAQAAHVCASAV